MGETFQSKHASVRMYTSRLCGYCHAAERLLNARGVKAIDKIAVDTDSAARETMIKLTGRYTVPQIFIGDQHVGGFDDLAALDRTGKLVEMLEFSDKG